MIRHVLLMAAILICSSFLTLTAQKKFGLEDYSKLVNISDPQISPDGKYVLAVVSKPDYDKNNFRSEIVLIDVAGKKSSVLVENKMSAAYPRWSPDGRQIAFIAKEKPEKNAVTQLFLMPSLKDTALLISSVPKGVQHFSWSPDGQKIAFVAADEADNKEEIEKGFTAFEVGNNDMFLGARPTSSHIWLLDVKSRSQKRLTSGEWSLPVTIPPGAPSSPLSWSSDGKSLLFVKVSSPYSGESTSSEIQILDIQTGKFKQLTRGKAPESYPSFSPDGRYISYRHKKDDSLMDLNQVWLTEAKGGEGKCISFSLDRELCRAAWMPDGKSMIVGAHDDHKTSLWQLGIDGKAKKLKLGDVCPNWYFWIDMSISNSGSLVFTASDPYNPTEIFHMASLDAEPVKITNYNKEIAQMKMGRTETLRWETEGWKHSGTLTYPTDYAVGKKYPLVLIIHGGPAAASVEQFSRLTQVFANKGYFVFEPNYRGSDNLGSAYKMAIVSDAAAGPGRDIMDGVSLVKKRVGIDEARIGVTGWSYGGFMTTWLAGNYDGWAAAMAGAAVTDLADQYNLSDYNVNRASAMGGSPWIGDNMKKYREQSPISYATNIKAPMLILANIGDPRVPVNQSYNLFHAMKDNGRVVKFIAWPVNAHNATDPITQRERDRYWIEWMDQYLK